MDAAAPLLCAGITVSNPLKNNNLLESPGKRIGIVGLGGLGHIAVKFGKAFGHHVTVISTSPSKENEARERLGADDFILSTNAEQMQLKKRSLDFILNTVSAEHSLGPILDLLKVKGTLVIVGAPEKPMDLPSLPLTFGKKVVKGSINGGIKETHDMMDVCGKHNITCDIEVVKTSQIDEALNRLGKNDVKYRFVFDIAGKSSALYQARDFLCDIAGRKLGGLWVLNSYWINEVTQFHEEEGLVCQSVGDSHASIPGPRSRLASIQL